MENIYAIKKYLINKHNEFIASIEDPEIKKIAHKGLFICGGAIPSLLLKEAPNDIDYYFKDKNTCKIVAQYYIDIWNKRNKNKAKVIEDNGRIRLAHKSFTLENQYKEVEKYSPIFLTNNAITLSGDIQLIIRFVGKPEEVRHNYDFIHTHCYFDPQNKELHLPQESLLSILVKELKYVGSKYPLASIFRTKKFIKKGWYIDSGQYLKMAMQLNEMDLSNFEVLEDQLTGVDLSVFIHIINKIKKDKEENKDLKINSDYICKLVDETFEN